MVLKRFPSTSLQTYNAAFFAMSKLDVLLIYQFKIMIVSLKLAFDSNVKPSLLSSSSIALSTFKFFLIHGFLIHNIVAIKSAVE